MVFSVQSFEMNFFNKPKLVMISYWGGNFLFGFPYMPEEFFLQDSTRDQDQLHSYTVYGISQGSGFKSPINSV